MPTPYPGLALSAYFTVPQPLQRVADLLRDHLRQFAAQLFATPTGRVYLWAGKDAIISPPGTFPEQRIRLPLEVRLPDGTPTLAVGLDLRLYGPKGASPTRIEVVCGQEALLDPYHRLCDEIRGWPGVRFGTAPDAQEQVAPCPADDGMSGAGAAPVAAPQPAAGAAIATAPGKAPRRAAHSAPIRRPERLKWIAAWKLLEPEWHKGQTSYRELASWLAIQNVGLNLTEGMVGDVVRAGLHGDLSDS